MSEEKWGCCLLSRDHTGRACRCMCVGGSTRLHSDQELSDAKPALWAAGLELVVILLPHPSSDEGK